MRRSRNCHRAPFQTARVWNLAWCGRSSTSARAESQTHLTCEQCGVIVLLPPGQTADSCPYCASNRFVSDAEKATWNAKQAALGYTAMNAAGGTMTGSLGVQGTVTATGDVIAYGSVPSDRRLKKNVTGIFDPLAKVRAIDPLDHWSGHERYLARANADALHQLKTLMRNEPTAYLELAVDYGNCGLYDEAILVLTRYVESAEKSTIHPLACYYLGYYSAKKGDEKKAMEYCRMAARMPAEYCFPFQLECVDVLQDAMITSLEQSKYFRVTTRERMAEPHVRDFNDAPRSRASSGSTS